VITEYCDVTSPYVYNSTADTGCRVIRQEVYRCYCAVLLNTSLTISDRHHRWHLPTKSALKDHIRRCGLT